MLERTNTTDQPSPLPPDGLRLVTSADEGVAPTVQIRVVTLGRRPTLHSIVEKRTADSDLDTSTRQWIDEHFAEHAKVRAQELGTPEARASYGLLLIGAGRASEAITFLEGNSTISPSFWSQYVLAQAYVATREPSKAEHILRTLAAADDIRALRLLSQILLEQGRFQEAIALLKNAAKEATDAHLLNDYAAALIALEKPKEAIKSLRSALRMNNRFAFAANNLGVCMAQIGQEEKAFRFFNEALALEPHCTPAATNLAEIFIRNHRFAEALEVLERAPANDVGSLERQAWCWLKSGNTQKPRRLLERAVELTGHKDPVLLTNLGAVALSTDPVAAEARFREAFRLVPDNPEFACNLAQLLKSRQDSDGAIRVLQAWEDTPEKAPPKLIGLLTGALTEVGALDRALRLLDKATRAFPNEERFWGDIGFLLTCRKERLALSIDYLSKGLLLNPASVVIRNNLAYSYIKVGDLAKAREVMTPLWWMLESHSNPRSPYVLATIGLLLIREGQFEEGRRCYVAAMETTAAPVRTKIRQKLLIEDAVHAIAQGRSRQAQQLLDKAIGLDADPEWTNEARQLRLSTHRN
jgi:Flp pilus assembly protein TadD